MERILFLYIEHILHLSWYPGLSIIKIKKKNGAYYNAGAHIKDSGEQFVIGWNYWAKLLKNYG